MCATAVLWNIFTANVDVKHKSTHQVKSATHTWLRTPTQDCDSIVEVKVMPDVTVTVPCITLNPRLLCVRLLIKLHKIIYHAQNAYYCTHELVEI